MNEQTTTATTTTIPKESLEVIKDAIMEVGEFLIASFYEQRPPVKCLLCHGTGKYTSKQDGALYHCIRCDGTKLES